MRIAFAFMSCVLAMTSVAAADGDLDLQSADHIVTTVAASSLPVRITGCFSDGRATNGLTLVHHAIDVENDGDRRVTALRLRFTFYDSFNEMSATHTNVADVKLAPGTSQKSINLAEWSDAGAPARITCSVDAIRYADGEIATRPSTRFARSG